MSMNVFDDWNKQKKKADTNEEIPGFKERELWFLKMGKNVGFEQDGKGTEFLRPIIVFKKFNTRVFWGVPMTGSEKKGPYYHQLPDINSRRNIAILSQIRLFDAKRMKYKIGVCPEKDFQKLKEKIKGLIDGTDRIRKFKPRRSGEARGRL